MKENKNIDRLFQERFKNFDVTPSEQAWKNIEFRLKEKKNKRKVIPFWWKLSGVAAVFVIGLGLYNFNFDDDLIPNNVVIENNVKENNKNNSNPIDSNKVIGSEVVSKSDNDSPQSIENKSQLNSTDTNVAVNENNISGGNSKNNVVVNSNNKEDKNKSTLKNNGIKVSNTVANNTLVSERLNTTSDEETVVNKTLNSNLKNNSNQSSFSVANKSKNEEIFNRTSNEKIVSNEIKYDSSLANKSLESNSKKENNNNSGVTNYLKLGENVIPNKATNEEQTNAFLNKNSNNIVAKTNTKTIENKINSDIKIPEIKKIDSTSVASVVPNAMEELLNEKEKKTVKEPKLNRWQLTSSVAPIYFSSTSNGSPLDSELKNNSKQYNTNFSYGLGVNYAVNKKIKIRTGVNTLSIDYNTNDVVFFQNANAKPLEHVKTNSMGAVIQIENKNSTSLTPEIASSGNTLKKFNSAINQKIGYVEVPLEMSYKVLDKKFGIDVIGGFSTLLLNQNEISVVSSGTQINIGEANNLSDIHFSTNLGFGMKYGFFKSFEARIEPVFKYQINTFNNDSGDFKPYYFGIYSGISFTF